MELQGILTPEEEAEDFVLLLRHGELVTTFSAHGAAKESLREFLDREGPPLEALQH